MEASALAVVPRKRREPAVSLMIQITPAPAAVSQVRHAATSLLTSWGLSAICEDAVLCLSEAVTNSVLHAPSAGTVTVAIEHDRHRVRIEVTDGICAQQGQADQPEPHVPAPRPPASPAPQPGSERTARELRGDQPEAGSDRCPESEPKEHGWGLQIIAAVADRWGMDAGHGGHRVWFEKDIPSARYPAVMP